MGSLFHTFQCKLSVIHLSFSLRGNVKVSNDNSTLLNVAVITCTTSIGEVKYVGATAIEEGDIHGIL